MSQLIRASITIDKDLMERFDNLVERSGHANRSEAIRDLIRHRLMEDEWDQDVEDAVATVTLVYDHHRPGLANEVETFGHKHFEEMISTTHVHLNADTCLEVVLLRGRPEKLRHIAEYLIGMRGVSHGKVVYSRATK